MKINKKFEKKERNPTWNLLVAVLYPVGVVLSSGPVREIRKLAEKVLQ